MTEHLWLIEDPEMDERRELTISMTHRQLKYLVSQLRSAADREWDGDAYRNLSALATQLDLAI